MKAILLGLLFALLIGAGPIWFILLELKEERDKKRRKEKKKLARQAKLAMKS